MSEGTIRERLEALFGPRWQAALDYVGVISRRRARELGAGESPSLAFIAMIELLESAPPQSWPGRWFGFGKLPGRCPCLQVFGHRLKNGRIEKSDAVFLWDVGIDMKKQRHLNVTVGMLPAAFWDLPEDHSLRVAWNFWNQQWDSLHGGATIQGWMSDKLQSPEGVVADWIARGLVDDIALAQLRPQFEQWINDYDHRLVNRLSKEFRSRYST